jgi:hypothetical protein
MKRISFIIVSIIEAIAVQLIKFFTILSRRDAVQLRKRYIHKMRIHLMPDY